MFLSREIFHSLPPSPRQHWSNVQHWNFILFSPTPHPPPLSLHTLKFTTYVYSTQHKHSPNSPTTNKQSLTTLLAMYTYHSHSPHTLSTHFSQCTHITHSLSYTLYHTLFVTHSSSHTLHHSHCTTHSSSHTLSTHSSSHTLITYSAQHTLHHTLLIIHF